MAGGEVQVFTWAEVLNETRRMAAHLQSLGLAPGSRIGCGVLVRAFSYVSGEVPDFAIVAGQPATVIGDTREADQAWLLSHPECRADYEAWAAPR